ncbi:helix-turn-helix domain-containing protein [Tissierella sp. Yu-01]|uniref:ArsR family transcriptional regulator n=1 Tax=Tissierella sp. Yu-01 TaxID=3035694 RepID=UPI00240D01C5|nr:helix-turn-helix domain-containing protein [Tissierella sp. Yu-01]WFA07781.1 ArsR family transcriptional regulator [Tissierella sp. Yu-01]
MENKIILSNEEELKVLMSPIRQKIIKQMSIEGKPVTSKHIADKLQISPSSAQHHIKQLQNIGVVEFDHSEVINGITAKYLRLSEKNISVGININDDLNLERDVLAKNILFETYNDYQNVINTMRPVITEEFNKGNKVLDFLSGAVHLSQDDANKLFELIDDFVEKHSKAAEDTHPFEFALISYRADFKK